MMFCLLCMIVLCCLIHIVQELCQEIRKSYPLSKDVSKQLTDAGFTANHLQNTLQALSAADVRVTLKDCGLLLQILLRFKCGSNVQQIMEMQ